MQYVWLLFFIVIFNTFKHLVLKFWVALLYPNENHNNDCKVWKTPCSKTIGYKQKTTTNKRARHWQLQGQIKRWLQPLDGVGLLRTSTHSPFGKVSVYHSLSPKRSSTFLPNGDWTICAVVLLTETYWWQTGWSWWPISGLAPLTVSPRGPTWNHFGEKSNSAHRHHHCCCPHHHYWCCHHNFWCCHHIVVVAINIIGSLDLLIKKKQPLKPRKNISLMLH